MFNLYTRLFVFLTYEAIDLQSNKILFSGSGQIDKKCNTLEEVESAEVLKRNIFPQNVHNKPETIEITTRKTYVTIQTNKVCLAERTLCVDGKQ